MKKQLVITDLTRMRGGRVCIVGYDAQGKCFRPVLPHPGITERLLYQNNTPIIFPFAIVEFDLQQHKPQPPHTEDWVYAPASVKFVRRVEEVNHPQIFKSSLFNNVGAIFEQTIHTDFGCYVMDGQGARSIGTIHPKTIHKVFYEQGEDDAWNYRLGFYDPSGAYYRLKIVDLTWNYYGDSLRDENTEPARVAEKLTAVLKNKTVYLRVGLARGWMKFPDRCYLQVTGIYTFPDYLQGKTFADLKKLTN
jgi:hypothetical protein